MDIVELGLSVRSDGVVVATDRLHRFENQSVRTDRAAAKLTSAVTRLVAVAGTALVAAFSVTTLFAYRDALAEVSTLVDTTTFSMQALSDAALQQAKDFGNVQGQVKAYYQIISAGAGSVAEATDILTASNKLAVGGVTDIATAADGLTSVLNAYGDKVAGATDVADTMFVGMVAGKTKIGELSASLGKVAPLAQQAGVSFQELIAAASALTKGGISTREAMTGLRAIVAAIAKPTSEATKMAKSLGLEFNATALETKGLTGFMADLVAKTGGSTDTLAQLFGGVEALVPVMALAGKSGVYFTEIMHNMAIRAGMSEEAFNKMANSPGFQSDRLMSGLTAEALRLTTTLGDSLVPVIKLLADNVDIIVPGFVSLAAGLAAYAAVAGTAAIATGALSGSVGLLGAAFALLTGPAGLVVLLTGAVTYLALKSDDLSTALDISTKAIEANKTALELAKGASVTYTNQLEDQIATQLKSAEATLADAQAKLEFSRISTQAMNSWSISSLGNEQSGLIDAAAKRTEKALENVVALKAQLSEISLGSGATWGALQDFLNPGETSSNISPLTPLTDEQKKAKEAYADLIRTAQQRIAQAGVEAQALGMTAQAANELRIRTDLLNQAANDNIALTPTQTAQLYNLASVTAAAEERTRLLTQAANDNDQIWGQVQDSASGFLKTLVRGGDVLDTLSNKLLNISDMLIDMAVKNLFSAAFGGVNPLNSLFGLGGGGFAPSAPVSPFYVGFAGGTNSAPGGWSWVGEQGPELRYIDRGTKIVPHQQSMRMAAGAANSNGSGNPVFDIRFGDIILQGSATEEDGAAFARGVSRELQKQLPDVIESYNSNPLRRVG